MIEVNELTKIFAGHAAVDGISFKVEKGDVVGFLGPNGAGKTTTMRMLSCYFPPTSGRASVAGCDVMTQSLEARKHIGYMPENVPLYTDMRVNEYLAYRASLKRIPKHDKPKRTAHVIERCGLGESSTRIIGQLSKGYRQRVGIADAMLSNPDILILDEPTIGLDPNQIIQVRNLIKDLGKDHTVILSTHILPEVEMVCNKVIIINQGKIAAAGSPNGLLSEASKGLRILVEVRGELQAAQALLKTVRFVKEVIPVIPAKNEAISSFIVICDGDKDVRESISTLCNSKGMPLRELRLDTLRLEDIFVKITSGKADELGIKQ